MLSAAVFWMDPAVAHEDPSVDLVELTREIELHPNDPELYIRRSDVHRSRREWLEAMADLQAASRLAPGLATVDLLAARTLLEADNPSAALTSIDRFLARDDNHAGGHLMRARILVRLGSGADAATEFTRGIDLARTAGHTATPDDYLERARVIAAQGGEHVDEAIRGLDRATSELGGAITIKLLAIELEIARGHWDAALGRLSAIEKSANRKETWIARRADVLWSAGRRDEAVVAYRSALQAIDALPARLRSTGAVVDLGSSIRTRLAESGHPGDAGDAGNAGAASTTRVEDAVRIPPSRAGSPNGDVE